MNLEKNLDQVNLMLQKIVTEKSSVSVQKQVRFLFLSLQILESKLKRYIEKSVSYEKEVEDLKEQVKF